MEGLTISQVENAFQPAREVNDANRFAGRGDAVREAYYGLVTEGAHIAIVGNRGIGKSSLARQISNIATGNHDLLDRLEIKHDHKLDFQTFYFACGENVDNTTELLERLLTSSKCMGEWVYDIEKARKIVTGYAPKFGANLLGIEASLGGEKKTEVSLEATGPEHSVDIVFTNAASAILDAKLARDGILIIIDEFDQIKNPAGFASFLKALATNVPRVKFCIVGVAQDIQNLMKEHQSADRLFAGSIISLPSMSDEELAEIVHIAEASVSDKIRYEAEASNRLIQLAQGHPYMVHLVGKYSFRLAFESNKNVLTADDVDATVRSIAERGADPVLEGRYKKVVASSEHREIVLKALAETQGADGEIWTGNAYKLALERGVDNASQYVGQIVTDDYGCEVEKLRERWYRFHDSLFATYVKLRPNLVVKSSTSVGTSS